MSNGLDVALMKDPNGEWSPEDGDHHTDIAFSDNEWGIFFFVSLEARSTTLIDGESRDDFYAREKLAFQESLKEYPLLSRLDDFYQDAAFTADEIVPLRNELRWAEKFVKDVNSRAFFDGMVAACDAAKSLNMGIRLLSS